MLPARTGVQKFAGIPRMSNNHSHLCGIVLSISDKGIIWTRSSHKRNSFFLTGLQILTTQLSCKAVIRLVILDQASLKFGKSGVEFHKYLKSACLSHVSKSKLKSNGIIFVIKG